MTHSRARALAVVISGLLLASPLAPVPAASTSPPEPTTPDDRAATALERVQELLGAPVGGTSHRRGAGGAPQDHAERRSLSLALRDLAATKHALDTGQRRTADRLLARPSDGSETPYGEPKYGNRAVERTCSPEVCVHWVESGQHATTRGYADEVRRAATRSHRVMEAALGYRPPLGDAGRGGDARPDIYLADFDGAYFGYAATEGYHVRGGSRARFGYIVLDEDYDEFCGGGCTDAAAQRLMRATTAHEYFHLVQFGYDYLEAAWFMEATATWIEDEVFDGINDNVNYLYSSPSALQTPWVPLDAYRAVPYGNWIWFRHLSEEFGPEVVRAAWDRADAWRGTLGTRDPRNLYSLLALRRAVGSEGGRWNVAFARFAADNQWARRYYDEGRELRYPSAPRIGTVWLTSGRRMKAREYRLHRLASGTHRFRPGRGLYRNWRLRVVVEGNTGARGGQALATIRRKNGRVQRVTMPLARNGRAVKRLPFGQSDVRWVDITVVNASTRYSCWKGQLRNTCRGQSLDNKRPQRVVVRAVR